MLLCIWYSGRAKHIDQWNTSSQARESDLVKKRVIDFLQWYKVNVVKANGYKILSKDKSGYYFVDRKDRKDVLTNIPEA